METPLPLIPARMRFDHWTLMSKGTHAQIFLAEIVTGELRNAYCVKLFRKDWMTPFNQEIAAYATLLKHQRIQKYIPRIYGYGCRTLSEWGLPAGDNTDIFYGIVMEWIEGAEKLCIENISVHLAWTILKGLYIIHEAGVLHQDTYSRNILVSPKDNRAVWIDFSCAHLNEPQYMAQEMGDVLGLILNKVSPLKMPLTASYSRKGDQKV